MILERVLLRAPFQNLLVPFAYDPLLLTLFA